MACAWFCSVASGAPIVLSHTFAAIGFILIASDERRASSKSFEQFGKEQCDRLNRSDLSSKSFEQFGKEQCDRLNRSAMRSQTHPKMIAGDFVTRATSGEDAVKEMLPECETLLAQDLGQLLDNIMEMYVLPWYGKISEDANFPNELRAVLARALGDVCSRMLDQVNLVSLILDGCLDALTRQIKAHGVMRASCEYAGIDPKTDIVASRLRHLEAIKRRNDATIRKLRKIGKLHPAVGCGDEKTSAGNNVASCELRYLTQLSGRLTQLMLTPEDKKCRAVKYLVGHRVESHLQFFKIIPDALAH